MALKTTFSRLHWGINLPVSNNGAFICLYLTKYHGEFISLCLTNKLLKYLLLSIKFIYVILY